MCITEILSWRAHIRFLCYGLSKTFFIIKSVKNTQSSRVLWNMCFAYFHSHLRYGMPLYFGGGTRESIKALQIQKKVISLTTGIKKYESCRQKFKENKILTVTSVYVLKVVCFIKKYQGDLKKNYEIRKHDTRSKYDLHTQSRNTSLLQKMCCTWVLNCINACPWGLKN